MSEGAERPCPRCGKWVLTFPNGELRPHAVPIAKRTNPKKSEPCKEPDVEWEPDASPPIGSLAPFAMMRTRRAVPAGKVLKAGVLDYAGCEIRVGDYVLRIDGELHGCTVDDFENLYFRDREPEPCCTVCGCTQNDACPEGCSWVAPNLCSACNERLLQESGVKAAGEQLTALRKARRGVA